MNENKKENLASKNKAEISKLNEEEKLLIERLERSTDALWADKAEVDYAYEKIKEYLPTKKTEVGNEVALDWEEIKKLQKEGALFEKAGNSGIF